MEDCEGILNGLCEEMKTAVLSFTSTLRECTRTHCDTNGLAIQKNISKFSQDQTHLLEARCGIEALMEETDPFRFIEAYRTTGKQCRRLLRRNMFYPEYVDMEMEALGVVMEMEMRKFLDEGLQSYITNAISAMCHASDAEEEEDEQEENEEELSDEEDDSLSDVLNSVLGDLSEEDDEEEEEEEEEEEDWGEDVQEANLSYIMFDFSSSEEENFEDV
ncbi:unnamed protein product [Tetraodon nigroviridis]|uniref:(spotted green pufferfish) hypothetical protein n=1 Tax=Tetraodon nigroviridis TaxID=99883 RepID=Q4SQS5_TETNG|nr:unnamed protein product [Tetraodon nigroviridis]